MFVFQVNRKIMKELEDLKEKDKTEQAQRVHFEQLSARVSSTIVMHFNCDSSVEFWRLRRRTDVS